MTYDWRSKLFLALSVAGIAIAVYHGYDEIYDTFTSCTLSSSFNCASVFQYGHDSFLGLRLWVYGAVWFPLCLAIGLWTLWSYGSLVRTNLTAFLMIGNIFTIWPWYIEIRLDYGHYCPVCISLYCINYVMTLIALTSMPAPGS